MTDVPPSPLSVRAGDLLGGKYRLDAALAEGGMGVVWRATHLELDCDVAIKLIRPDHSSNDAVVARLLAEARIAASLRSKHVNRVLDVGRTEAGTPYLVLEYLSGCDLGAYLEQKGRLSLAEAVDYVLQACEGLAGAHAASIVHRDLKPENLFLSHEADGTLVLKVLDFGISKAPEARRGGRMLTNPFELIGSPSYMAPEQIRGATVDLRSDIWALGTLLHELCSGELLFDGRTVTETFAKILDPAWRLPRIPDLTEPRFYAVVERCLQKDPADRYQSVAELARELSPLSNDETRAPRVARVAEAARGHAEVVKTPVAVTTTHLGGTTARSASEAPRKPWRGLRRTAFAVSPLFLLALGAAARPFFVHPMGQPERESIALATPLGPTPSSAQLATQPVGLVASVSTALVTPNVLGLASATAAVMPMRRERSTVMLAPAPAPGRATLTNASTTLEPRAVSPASVPSVFAPPSPSSEPPRPAPSTPAPALERPRASAADAWDPETFGGRR